MIAISVVQSSVQTFIHNAILFIDTCYNQAHWLIGMPYLSIIASNVNLFEQHKTLFASTEYFETT